MRLVVLVLAMLALTGGGSARGDVAVSADAPDEPIPASDTSEVIVTVSASCAVIHAAPAPPAFSLSVAEAPRWLDARVQPDRIPIDRFSCNGDRAEAHAMLRLTPAPSAPAHEPDVLRVVVELEGTDERTANESSFRVQVAPLVRVDVEILANDVVAEPQRTIDFRVRAVNLGNVATKLALRVAEEPAGWVVPTPQPVTLAGPADEPRESILIVIVQTPFRNGRIDESATILVEWRAIAALGDAANATGLLELRARAVGNYLPAPGVMALLVVSVSSAAIFGRRRT